MGNINNGIGRRRVKRNNVGDEVIAGRLKQSGLDVGQKSDPELKDSPTSNEEDQSASKDRQPQPDMDNLRVLARQSYLNKREELKLQVLIEELAHLEGDIKTHGWNSLSKSEQDEVELKRELVALVQQRDKNNDEGFQFQDDYIDQEGREDSNRKRQLLQRKYAPQTENKSRQQLWENQQLRNAVQSTKGEVGVDDIHVEGGQDYEFVFDDEAIIEFTGDSNEDVLPELESEYDQKLINELDREQARLQTIQETRQSLPVYRFRDSLLSAIKENQVMIIVGETGSGKTTQLPQYLVEDGYTKNGKFQIACTQPRRVAATSVATRVADEMNVVLGKEVGYSIRFDDKTTPEKTILKYMTDGMLLREFMADPELKKYACIIIDEAHERTLATDVLLGLLKDILPHRKDLKLLISSATMNAAKFADFFYDAPIFNVPGRRFPVDIHYTLQPEANYLNAAITTIFQIHTTQALPGDILVFLTGQEEIEAAQQSLEEIAHVLGSKIKPMIIAPIYANLPQEQQSKIFDKTPKDCRKVVLATNIAETSLTIDGIKYVIDPGFVKENSFVAATGMSQLLTVPCSRASVDQRAGRAGRVGPGKCFRIFTKWSYFNELDPLPKPEILRTNLSQVVLLLLSLGVTDLIDFPLLDKPSIPALSKALENLYVLGALNSKGAITRLGRMMCEFPCEPDFGKVMHTAATHGSCKGVLEEVITIIAMLHETASIFAQGKADREGNKSSVVGKVSSDHILYLETFNSWKDMNYSRSWCFDHKVQYKTLVRVRNIRDQLWKCCDKLGLVALNEQAVEQLNGDDNAEPRIVKSFISGFPSNIAKLGASGYHTMGAQQGGVNVSVHPTSIVFQSLRKDMVKPTRFILYQRLVLTSKEFMRDCLPIPREEWLHEMVPHYFKAKS
ncbi:LANO_0A02322g1_1 [Lachancea nothofagi CBS 11611]|uniref:RNA helicase n=1 Tax=Lachancea nothofagi CBS 11611 TaxID=1266666 RepID=A0A1G4IND3_9SACH|nr:LANO_0A02322g1_1 [Lachancea nothofagi CBS 11611]